MGVLLTTTGILGTVVLDDLGGRSFVHPVVGYDLTEEFKYDRIRFSDSLGEALDAGHVSILSDGEVVGNSSLLKLIEPKEDTIANIGGGAASMVMSFSSGTSKHVETASTTYVSLAHFIYGGSDEIGGINNFNVNAWITNNGTVDVRLFDLTNNAIIAELTGINSLLESNVQSMGAISNLPTLAAVIEIQGRKATGGGAASKLRIASLEIQY